MALTDNFDRANTTTAAGLGTAPSGLVWTSTSGLWQIQTNRAYTVTDATSSPIATVTLASEDIDISVSVSPTGGDALYIRVTDFNDWYRLRVQNDTYTYVSGTHEEPYQYISGSHEEQVWTPEVYSWDGTYNIPGFTSQSNYYPSTSSLNYPLGSNYAYDTEATTLPAYAPGSGLLISQCYTILSGGLHYVTNYSTRIITPNFNYTPGFFTTITVNDYSTGYNTVTDYTTAYIYKAIFEKSVAGVVTALATYVLTVPTTSLRVVTFGSNFRIFINGSASSVGIVTDASSIATKHGIGRGGTNTANSGTAIDNFSIVAITAPPVISSLLPTSGTTVTTGKPTVGSTLNMPTSGQQIKGRWQFATDSNFIQDVIIVDESDSDFRSTTGATTEVLTEATRLTQEGTWYFRGCAVDEYGGVGAWSAANTLIVNIAVPNTPTAGTIVPASGAVVTTDVPQLSVTLVAAPDGQVVTGEWQLATDAGFTANVKTVTDTDFVTSGISNKTIPDASQLYQTTWYIRARAVDQYSQYSGYTAATTFTVAHVPSTSGYSPTAGIAVIYSASNTLSWSFNDTSSVDTQSALEVLVDRNDTGLNVISSGKLASTDNFTSVAIPTSLKDVQLRWRVRVWDSDDVVSAWSAYQLFKVADAPVVTITSPNTSTVSSGRPAVTWTFSSSGKTQATYRVTYTKTGSVIPTLDTGIVIGAATSYAPSVVVIHNNENYDIKVWVVDSIGLPDTDTVNVTAVYVVPNMVNFAAEVSTYSESGYVRLTWLYAFDTTFLRWRIYRRLLGDDAWDTVGEITEITVNEFKDWKIPANSSVEYSVVMVAERFGEEVESSTNNAVTVTVGVGDYWLLDPINDVNNCKLFQVKGDDYTDNYEMSEYTVVGRGRHVDYGESIGISGTLSAQIRDSATSTARAKKQAIEALKRKRIPVFLKTPFGDLYYVSLGDVGLSRIAGTGASEHCDITIPYLEIF